MRADAATGRFSGSAAGTSGRVATELERRSRFWGVGLRVGDTTFPRHKRLHGDDGRRRDA
jgi:hypothetical protein